MKYTSKGSRDLILTQHDHELIYALVDEREYLEVHQAEIEEKLAKVKAMRKGLTNSALAKKFDTSFSAIHDCIQRRGMV